MYSNSCKQKSNQAENGLAKLVATTHLVQIYTSIKNIQKWATYATLLPINKKELEPVKKEIGF